MDQGRFEEALLAMQASTTRRRGLAALLAVLLGGEAASARERRRDRMHRSGKRGPKGEGTCPNCKGCCSKSTCKAGTSVQACGRAGQACKTCQAGQACKFGACICTTTSCTGCCSGGVCRAGNSTTSCGKSGGACTECRGATPLCCRGTCSVGVWTERTSFETAATGTGNRPRWVTPTRDGLSVFTTDTDSNRVLVWSRPNASSTTWTQGSPIGSAGSGANQLSRPLKVVVSPDQRRLWVTDKGNDRVSVWTRDTATATVWTNETAFGSSGSGSGKLSGPTGLAVSADGLTAWVVDNGNRRVAVWTRPGAASTDWTHVSSFGSDGAAADQFSWPSDVAVASSGMEALVLDERFGQGRVAIWTRASATATTWTYRTSFSTNANQLTSYSSPTAIALSGDDLTIWISINGEDRFAVWNRPSAGSTSWTMRTSVSLNGTSPFGIGALPTGSTVWLANSDEQRIQVFTRGC